MVIPHLPDFLILFTNSLAVQAVLEPDSKFIQNPVSDSKAMKTHN